jgi:hypothetical protein
MPAAIDGSHCYSLLYMLFQVLPVRRAASSVARVSARLTVIHCLPVKASPRKPRAGQTEYSASFALRLAIGAFDALRFYPASAGMTGLSQVLL